MIENQTICNCVGPQNGEPLCPCRMRNVARKDGRWVEVRDLGPTQGRTFEEFAREVKGRAGLNPDPQVRMTHMGLDGGFSDHHGELRLIDAAIAAGDHDDNHWVMNAYTYTRVLHLMDADGNHLFWPDLIGPPPYRILGMPVTLDASMPNVEDDGAAIEIRRGQVTVVQVAVKLS